MLLKKRTLDGKEKRRISGEIKVTDEKREKKFGTDKNKDDNIH